MFQHDLDSKTKVGYRPRQMEGQQAPAGSPLRHDPLARITGRVGNPASINTHAAILNRTMASRSSQARHSLLKLQRQYGNRYVQRVVELARQGEGDVEVSPEVEQAIQRTRGGGQVLDSGVRMQMESAFGVDFSGVRVHMGSEADGLNRALSARAFTTGRDIFFRQGEYNPGSSGGRKLLAHELTHVVQQKGTGIQGKLSVNYPGDRFEREADQVADEVMQISDREMVRISEPVSRPALAHVQQSPVDRKVMRRREETVRKKFLRDIQVPRVPFGAFLVPKEAIKETREFKSYMDPNLVWQWGEHVLEEEALVACRLMLGSIEAGIRVNWRREARQYLTRARAVLRQWKEFLQWVEEARHRERPETTPPPPAPPHN